MPPRGGGGPRGGGPRGGGSRGGGPMGSPRGSSPMGGGYRSPVSGGARPHMNAGRVGGYHRGFSPFSLIIFVFIFALAIITTYPIIGIALFIIAIVGLLLNYKYKKDRAEAAEMQEMLNTDLNELGSSDLSDLENKYK